MKFSEWNVSDLDGCCIFSISNFNEDDLFDYLNTIQQYILQLGMGDYSVLSIGIVEYHDSELKDLDIITDFPYSYFSLFNPDWTGAIEIIL